MGTYEEEAKRIADEVQKAKDDNKVDILLDIQRAKDKAKADRKALDAAEKKAKKKKKKVQKSTTDTIKKFIQWNFQYVQDPTGELGPVPNIDPRLIHQAENFLVLAEKPLSHQDHLEGFRLIEELGNSFKPFP